MDTCCFIVKLLVPTVKWPTYGRIICNFCPQKKEQNCTRLIVGGNQIDYPGNKSTPTANLTTTKLLINLTISMPRAVFLGINLASFYLNTPLQTTSTCDYAWTSSQKTILAYNLCNIVDPDGWVYIKIRKGMYSLPQAGILVNKLLEQRLSARGYYQCQHKGTVVAHVAGHHLLPRH
jgi:hypothetical protein